MKFDVVANAPMGRERVFPVHSLVNGNPCVISIKDLPDDDGEYIRVFAGSKDHVVREYPTKDSDRVLQEVHVGDFIGLYTRKNGTLFLNSFYVKEVTQKAVRCIRAIL